MVFGLQNLQQRQVLQNRGIEDDYAIVILTETKYVTDEIAAKKSTLSLEVKKCAREDQLNEFVSQWFSPLAAIYIRNPIGNISAIFGWHPQKN